MKHTVLVRSTNNWIYRKNPFKKLKKPWKKTKSDSEMDSDQTDFDKIKKTSVFWKALGLRKHECTKLIIEYIRDMKKIWNSYEKENSDGKFLD